MKQNLFTKNKKITTRIVAILSLSCLISAVALTVQPTTKVLADTRDATSNQGYWTGKDGDCEWSYDVGTWTLTISATKEGNSMSSQPLYQALAWHQNIRHIVFSSPVKLPANSSKKFLGLSSLEDFRGLDLVDTSDVTNMSELFMGWCVDWARLKSF